MSSPNHLASPEISSNHPVTSSNISSDFHDSDQQPSLNQDQQTSPDQQPSSSPEQQPSSSPNTLSSSSPSPSPPPPTNSHPMLTRSKTGNLKPKVFPSQVEPATVKQTLSQPHWLEAMKAKYDALMKNNT